MSDARLTPRQQQILDWIERRSALSGAPPTRAEIAAAFGFRSVNAAEDHLRALERKGVIGITPGCARGIRLLDRRSIAGPSAGANARPAALLPLIGRVAAGSPILAQQNVETELTVDPALFHPRADYLLRVHGESMRDAGILDGDLLAVHRSPQAENRQIVVARIGEEVTVKRLERSAQGLRLLPCNPDFAPITLDPDREDFAIEGLAVGVLRRFP